MNLVAVPENLARHRLGHELRAAPELLAALERWKRILIEHYDADSGGALIVNSLYRPAETTCEKDEGGRIDLSDANGHWTGRSVDYSARLTSWSLWGEDCPKWRRDDLRDALQAIGILHPWYWRIVGGRRLRHEYWHAAIEVAPWKQAHANRDPVPHWYDALRPEN